MAIEEAKARGDPGHTIKAAFLAHKERAREHVTRLNETLHDRDARRYAEWEARGKASAPRKDRLRPKRQPAPPAEPLILVIARIQGFRCVHCAGEMDMASREWDEDQSKPSIEHVIPRSLGGQNVGNRLVAHRGCNTEKGSSVPSGCEMIWLLVVNAHLGHQPQRF